VIWGAGPVFLLPTATDDFLGGEKWGIGPTVVALLQDGPWTYGVLANHLWASEGNDDRSNLSLSFIQPFLSYSLGKGLTVGLAGELAYDWKGEQWTAPLVASVSQMVPIAGRLFSFGLGFKYFVDTPDNGSEWGI
jgi:hypothetical protein